MPNLASALKGEISRLSWGDIKEQVGTIKRAALQHRRDIAELKRLVQDLFKRRTFLEAKDRKRVSAKAPPGLAEGARF